MSLALEVKQLMFDARVGRRYAHRQVDLSRLGAENVLTPFWVMTLSLVYLLAQRLPDEADGRQITADFAQMLDRHPEIDRELPLRTAQALARAMHGDTRLFMLIKEEVWPTDFALVLCLLTEEASLTDAGLNRLLSTAERLAARIAQHLGPEVMPLDRFNARVEEWMEQFA